MPSNAAVQASTVTRPSAAPAKRPASSSLPSPSISEYTGITDALSVPSPSNTWMTLGVRIAAAQTSITAVAPRNRDSSASLTKPMTRLKKIPAPTRKAARDVSTLSGVGLVGSVNGWEGLCGLAFGE